MEKINFYTQSSLDETPELRMVIDVSGNVGIGESNPTKALEVAGDISFNGNLYQNGSLFVGGGGGLTDLSATSISDLSDVSLNGIQVNQTLKWDGSNLVPTTLATSITKQGQVLETLAGVCDGRSVTVESGTYTLENVTTYQDIGSTYSKATGSGISYKPPVGTSQVIYRYYVYTRFKDGNTNSDKFCYKIKLDNTFITDSNKTYRNDRYTGEEICISYVINIGNNNISNGEILSWNTLKNIEVHVVDFDNATEMYLHDLYYLDGNYLSLDSTIRKPRIEIVAIGESAGQAVTLTNNSVSDLSDISFNSTTTTDGQALVWNSTDGVWQAGTVGSNTIDETTDVSLNNLDVYGDISAANNIIIQGKIVGGKSSSNLIQGYNLDVSGNGIFSGSVTANGSVLSSDDRIKHNEEPITNALSTISKLKPKHYFKTTSLYDESHHFRLNNNNEPINIFSKPLVINKDYTIETGIIAQELLDIPELKFAVQNTTPLGVDYNSIHCTHIAATNELYQLVKSQQTELEQQQEEIENLKLVNQDLNNQFNNFIKELQDIKQHLGI